MNMENTGNSVYNDAMRNGGRAKAPTGSVGAKSMSVTRRERTWAITTYTQL